MQDVEPGRPVRSQLASAAKSPEEAFRRMKNKTFVVETKFDGQCCLEFFAWQHLASSAASSQNFHTPSVGCGLCHQTLWTQTLLVQYRLQFRRASQQCSH